MKTEQAMWTVVQETRRKGTVFSTDKNKVLLFPRRWMAEQDRQENERVIRVFVTIEA
jgi:hypothetical protein